MARYYSFPSVEKMWQAERKIGESEICLRAHGLQRGHGGRNITTCNEEEEPCSRQLSQEVQGPGFFVIIAGNSAADFEYKKRVIADRS